MKLHNNNEAAGTDQTMTDKAIVRRCPVCSGHPVVRRYNSSYWHVRCETSHLAESSACPMKTKKGAWQAWDDKFNPR